MGTEPARLRVFLRASDDYEAVGAGKRYAFTKKDLPQLKKRFKAWESADDKKKADRKARLEAERAASKATTTPAPAEEPEVDDTLDLDDVQVEDDAEEAVSA